MPLLKISSSVRVDDQAAGELALEASRLVAAATGKPEMYVMVTVEASAIAMGGTKGPAAFGDVRGIGGLTPKVNKQISAGLCALLEKRMGIPPERIYITFTDVAAQNWGWKGATFG